MAASIIVIGNQELLKGADSSNIKSQANTGDLMISVYSIQDFSISDIILIGEFGNEDSEIVKVHASTYPSGSTVTLASAMTKDHPADTKVYIIPYDQIEISYSATTTGSKTVLNTISVDPESVNTDYKELTQSSGYFFTRYKNSTDSTYADYSDPIPYGGFATNTVSSLINIALDETNKDFSEKLTYDTLLYEINSCLRFIRGKLKRWGSSAVYDYIIGDANRGIYSLALESDYYDTNSNRSTLQVRVGTGKSLSYVDKIEFDDLLNDVSLSTASSLTASGSTSLVLSDSSDFDSSGTIHVFISNTLYEITYTGNDTTTNTLSGIPASGTGAITVAIPASTNVWQNESESTPRVFTIYGGRLYFWPMAGSSETKRNVYHDYNTDIVEVNSDSDEIPLARFDMIKHWLKWVIRNATERNGTPDVNDPDFQLFNVMLTDAVRRETAGQKYKMTPKTSGISYRNQSTSQQSYEDYLRN